MYVHIVCEVWSYVPPPSCEHKTFSVKMTDVLPPVILCDAHMTMYPDVREYLTNLGHFQTGTHGLSAAEMETVTIMILRRVMATYFNVAWDDVPRSVDGLVEEFLTREQNVLAVWMPTTAAAPTC
jgi:hypothetical protein